MSAFFLVDWEPLHWFQLLFKWNSKCQLGMWSLCDMALCSWFLSQCIPTLHGPSVFHLRAFAHAVFSASHMLLPPDIGRACSLEVQSSPKCHLLREAVFKMVTTPEHPYSPPCFISLQSTYCHPIYFTLHEPTVCFSFLGCLRLWSLPLDRYSVSKPSSVICPWLLRAQLCPLIHPAPVTLASTKFLELSKHSPVCACRDSDDGGVLPALQVRRRAGCRDQEADCLGSNPSSIAFS